MNKTDRVYVIDKDLFEIVDGPYTLNSTTIKKRTGCGNPWLLDNLSDYDIAVEVMEPLGDDEKYDDVPTVTTNTVTYHAVAKTQAELDIEMDALNDSLVAQEFGAALEAGYDTGRGFTMQTKKHDYEMMEDGLNVQLNGAVELGGAGGDDTVMTAVRDIDNNPQYMTIADALVIADEMKENYWILWNRKSAYRDALSACATKAEMYLVTF